MRPQYLDSIRSFEGFTAHAGPDYKQWSNGYGTRARHPGEVIDRVEAEHRFQVEITAARQAVARFAPTLDEGSAAALTSLTFNAGPAWMTSGLGAAIKADDMGEARHIFARYVHAGGEVLPGLVQRRAIEAQWFGNGAAGHPERAAPPTVPSAPVGQDLLMSHSDPAGPENVAAPARDLAPPPADAAPVAITSPSDRGITAGDDGPARFLALLAEMRVLALLAHPTATDRIALAERVPTAGERRRDAGANTSI